MILVPNIFTILTYDKDDYLDATLSNCIDSGLKSMHKPNHYIATVVFNNNIKYTYWDANKFTSWLSESKIGDYNYAYARPSARTMRKFRKLLASKNISN